MKTPVEPLWAMTFPAPAAVPPIVLLVTEVAISTPKTDVSNSEVAGHVGADLVPLDDSVGANHW